MAKVHGAAKKSYSSIIFYMTEKQHLDKRKVTQSHF